MDKKRTGVSIALIGRPGTGKKELFHALIDRNQHAGKRQGSFSMNHQNYFLTCLPGFPSHSAFSETEKIISNYLIRQKIRILLMACDATCLKRDLYLLKQILSLDLIRDHKIPLILWVNFCDEAERKGIEIDFGLLKDVLQIPVLKCRAHCPDSPDQIRLTIAQIENQSFNYDCLDFDPEQLAREIIHHTRPQYRHREEITDRILLNPVTGTVLIFLLLLGISWFSLTIAGFPAFLLWNRLFCLESNLVTAMSACGCPPWLSSLAVHGVYQPLIWIFFMVLPPLTIFFLFFSLAEDSGCLPRIAFHMTPAFERCHVCGKQCLTAVTGLSCNTLGIAQCQILDSPREKLIAILTASFMPCSRQFPALFLMVMLLFLPETALRDSPATVFPLIFSGLSLASAFTLTLTILLGMTLVLVCSWLLAHTLLPGTSSVFALELPPLRCSRSAYSALHSLQNHIIPALIRSVLVILPSAFLVCLLTEFFPDGFAFLTGLLEPLGKKMGLDGIILLAFLMSFPASEALIPVILTTYLQTEASVFLSLSSLLADHGWTRTTIVCILFFHLFHGPCLTAVRRIKKETGSWKWTAVSLLLPTLPGLGLCILLTEISRLFLR